MTALDPDEFVLGPCSERVPAIVSSLLGAAVAAFDVDRVASRRNLMRAAAILQVCVACAEEQQQTRSPGGLARWQLNKVLNYIDHHLPERITATRLAALVNVSLGQFFRAFKASVGIPPLQFVASRRLELACSLLRYSREPLSQVAFTTGFSDQSHLCRVFRRVTGVTPTAWRRANAMDPGRDDILDSG